MPIVGLPPTIAAIYKTGVGQSIPNGIITIVNFTDKAWDTHAAVATGAAWVFTAPAAGFYQVSASVVFAQTATWVDGELAALYVYVNDIPLSYLEVKDSYGSASLVYLHLSGSTLVYLNAGDYLNFRVYQTSGAALALTVDPVHNRISIVKFAGS